LHFRQFFCMYHSSSFLLLQHLCRHSTQTLSQSFSHDPISSACLTRHHYYHPPRNPSICRCYLATLSSLIIFSLYPFLLKFESSLWFRLATRFIGLIFQIFFCFSVKPYTRVQSHEAMRAYMIFETDKCREHQPPPHLFSSSYLLL
jgi:hypothetical protein